MNEKYLPIGTVVILKGATKRLMITGYYTKSVDDNEVKDYVGVIYPEGAIASFINILFNHDQIEKVFHMGLEDEEEKEYMVNLKELVRKVESGEEQLGEPLSKDEILEQITQQQESNSVNVGVPLTSNAAPALTPPAMNQAPMMGPVPAQPMPAQPMGPMPGGPAPMPNMMAPGMVQPQPMMAPGQVPQGM